MENVLIFTPFWRRPEIVELYVSGINRLRDCYPNIDLCCVVSPEDPHIESIVKMLRPLDPAIISVKNDYLGRKKNAGLKWVLKNMKFDYLMELNSDGVINPELMNTYKIEINRGVPMFGMKNIHFMNWQTKEVYFVRDYAEGMTYGSARMYKKDYLPDSLWPDTADCGLDMQSWKLLKSLGIQSAIVDTGEYPMVLDIKTDINVFPWEMITQSDLVLDKKPVEFEDIAPHFGL